MNFNRYNLKIQTTFFGLKIEKKKENLGVTPCDFFQFLAQNFLLEFSSYYD